MTAHQTSAEGHGDPRDPAWFRQVLSQYPTGVGLVTSIDGNGAPIGMTVGSFTSVSLDPPLVAFLPQKGSSTYQRIRESGAFCVNILAAEQEALCRRFAAAVEDRFALVCHRPSPSGLPIIEACVAWIECRIESITEAGDHDIVLGRVEQLDIEIAAPPLLFYQGGYGHFSALSLSAEDPLGLLRHQLRCVDQARPAMEAMALQFDARCIATVRTGDEVVIAASAGTTSRGSSTTFVGQRLPFVPPSTALFAAPLPQKKIEGWILRAPPEARSAARRSVDLVRERGYSLGLASDAQRDFATTLAALDADNNAASAQDLRVLMQRLSFEPETLDDDQLTKVRIIAVPVGKPDDEPALVLSLYDFPRPGHASQVRTYVEAMQQAGRRLSVELSNGLSAAVDPPK